MLADLDMMRVNIRSLFDLVELFGYIKIDSRPKTPAYHAHLYSLNITS